ncbi:protein prenylyltransferase [Plenodomus tracheiphilus IPT5]|uniref:Protein prenylyltransferase n=1 Tax=Plenodomus tracheiphilus IPT5 TaxID=1408161 RepID=A0A6A7AVI2_9PLEO|nr:protein prenylyltransferase [Plenodomus tracheiphilus IPT5]
MGSPRGDSLQALAYERLADFFQQHRNDVCEIEVLPPAVQPPDGIILEDGLHLGIPKKILALAYVEARRRFFASKEANGVTPAALQATKIMLLFDPEHLTAANYRKRWLDNLGAETGSQYESTFHKALRQELNFLNTILTSPLHRQSKSPTLWHHRLWILDPLFTFELKIATDSQCQNFWYAELAAVCKSGERHPKNYYAWQYARRILPRMIYEKEEVFVDVVKDWCCKHPSDISGWTFLLALLSGSRNGTKAYATLRDVVHYTITLRAEQESLWIFIWTAAERCITPKEYTEICALFQENEDVASPSKNASMPPDQGSDTSRWSTLMGRLMHVRKHPVDAS